MKILTFNIWNMPGSIHRTARMAAIGETLRKGDWDLVALQEMWPTHERTQFDACGYAYTADIEHPWRRPQNWLLAPAALLGYRWIVDTGLRVLSRYPIQAQAELRYPLTAAQSKAARSAGGNIIRRGAMAVRLQMSDLGAVWVVNTHLIASTRHGQNNSERRAQLNALRAWIDQTLIDAPVVIAGDLNMGPPLPGSRASEAEADFWDQALAGPLAGFRPDPAGLDEATWTEQSNPYAAVDPDHEHARLDHILAGPGLIARHARVMFAESVDLPGGKHGHLSDHFGLEAQIARI